MKGDSSLSSEILERSVTQTSALEQLRERISTRKARVGVLGLGYVGLPLAVEFARAGFDVVGIDIQQAKVDHFNSGRSYIKDVKDDVFAPLIKSGKLRATTDFSVIRELDTIDICVPTPLRKTKDPDMSFVVAATDDIAEHLHPGLLVMLESTTYPGTTDELVLPMLAAAACKSAKTSSSASRRNASIPATRDFRPPIFQRWSAASRRPAPKWARCSMSKRSKPWFRSVPRASPKW